MQSKNDEHISVLIVEDHPIFREALRGFVETHPDQFRIVGDVGSKKEGLRLVREHVPDIVLLDLGLPERTEEGLEEGLEAIQEIRAISPATQVVILTAHRKPNYVFQAIEAGAVAYLLKEHVEGHEVVDSLLRVYRGDPPIDPEIARQLWSYFQNPNAMIQSPMDELTTRELEILQLIAEGKTNQEIAQELSIAYSTVKKHVSNTLSKLQMRSRVELMLYYRTNYSQLNLKGLSQIPPDAT